MKSVIYVIMVSSLSMKHIKIKERFKNGHCCYQNHCFKTKKANSVNMLILIFLYFYSIESL